LERAVILADGPEEWVDGLWPMARELGARPDQVLRAWALEQPRPGQPPALWDRRKHRLGSHEDETTTDSTSCGPAWLA